MSRNSRTNRKETQKKFNQTHLCYWFRKPNENEAKSLKLEEKILELRDQNLELASKLENSERQSTHMNTEQAQEIERGRILLQESQE